MSRKYCEVDKLLVKMRACVVPLTFLGINVKVIEATLFKGVSCKGNVKKSFDTFVEKLSDLVDMIIKELGSKNAEMEKEIKRLDPKVLHQLKRLALLQTATLYYFGPQKLTKGAKKGSPGKIEILNTSSSNSPKQSCKIEIWGWFSTRTTISYSNTCSKINGFNYCCSSSISISNESFCICCG